MFSQDPVLFTFLLVRCLPSSRAPPSVGRLSATPRLFVWRVRHPSCDQGIALSRTVRRGLHSTGATPADFQETRIAELVLDVWVDSAPYFATGADLSPHRSDSGADEQGSAESLQDFAALVDPRSSGSFPLFAPSL